MKVSKLDESVLDEVSLDESVFHRCTLESPNPPPDKAHVASTWLHQELMVFPR